MQLAVYTNTCVIHTAHRTHTTNNTHHTQHTQHTAHIHTPALRKQTKRLEKAVRERAVRMGSDSSLIDWRDNFEQFKRKSCRSRKHKRHAPYKARVLRIPMTVSSTNPHARVQFTTPLRQSPLPALSLADFTPSADGQAQLLAFRTDNMVRALARLLCCPADPVARQLTIERTLHADGVAAKVCNNAACADRFRTLYASLKRKCKVSAVNRCFMCVALTVRVLQRCRGNLVRLDSLGVSEAKLIAVPADSTAAVDDGKEGKADGSQLLSRVIVPGAFGVRAFVRACWVCVCMRI